MLDPNLVETENIYSPDTLSSLVYMPMKDNLGTHPWLLPEDMTDCLKGIGDHLGNTRVKQEPEE